MSRDTVERLILLAVGLLAVLFIAPVAHCQSCVTSSQVTITGTLRAANGIPTSNAILTLTPSQAGFIAGCGVNVPTATTCATSTDGSVVQTPNPLDSPLLSTSGSGTLPSGVYYVVYEWYDSLGHVTLPSPESRQTLSSSGTLVVNPPASGVPSTAAGMDVFIGTTSGGETLQGQTTGSASFAQSTALSSGSSPVSTNNTVCVATANDAVWPTGTGYVATMTDSDGNGLPGFPMQWQLLGAGTTINLSNGWPYYHGVVTYPVPILASPQNHGQQSITGSLNLSGYNLLNAGKVGVGTSTPGWALDVENGPINTLNGYLVNGSGGTIGKCLASDGNYYDTPVSCITSLPTLYYQTIYADGSAQTQRSGLNFASPLFTVSDSASPSQTSVSLTASGTGLTLVTTPSSPGASTALAQFDGNGNVVPFTGGSNACASFTPTATSGCTVLPDGKWMQWTQSSVVSAGSRGARSVSFPVAFPNNLYTIQTAVLLSSANTTTNWEGQAVYVQPFGTSVTGCSFATGLTGACLYIDSRSDATPDTGLYAIIWAIGN